MHSVSVVFGLRSGNFDNQITHVLTHVYMKASREALKHFNPHAQTNSAHSLSQSDSKTEERCSRLMLSSTSVTFVCLMSVCHKLPDTCPRSHRLKLPSIWTLVSPLKIFPNSVTFKIFYLSFLHSHTQFHLFDPAFVPVLPAVAPLLLLFFSCVCCSPNNFYHQCCWGYLLSLTVEWNHIF